MQKKYIVQIAGVIAVLAIVNIAAASFYKRFDLTKDKRYTLSETTNSVIKKVKQPVIVDVLLEGNFPAEFKRLQVETLQLLEEFSAKNKNIKFNFINPLESEADRQEVIGQLQSLGLTPTQVTVQDNGKVSQELIFPWAIANMGEQSVKIPLLKNKLGTNSQERVNNSVQQLEYAFTDALTKLTTTNKKKIAIIKGNGELEDIKIADFLSTIRYYYSIAPFTLDSVASNPERTLNQLKSFDLALIAKPTVAFTEEQKYVLDQFIMHGGKSVWLVDHVIMEVDSLYNETGKNIAVPRDLNLNDFFFKYGVRVNPALINDLYFTQIVLASGDGSGSQYNPVPWVYHPMVISKNNHPITNNIEAVRFQFTNPIDTVGNSSISKTVLLTSSNLSKVDGVPAQISLDITTKQPDQTKYNDGNKPLAVLLEGNFSSVYKNRVKPLKITNNLDDGQPSQMLVISDGDVIRNQLRNGRPLELGYDKWTNNFYGNKEFLLNAINYMLDHSGLVTIRTKKVNVAFLDTQKITDQKTNWQLLNLLAPIAFFIMFGLVYNFIKRKKYS
jgi:gliding-associated putative ABC transporter substrate-binding component GldG